MKVAEVEVSLISDFLRTVIIIVVMIVTALVPISFTQSDFIQRIRFQTHSNCVIELSSSMNRSADSDYSAYEYYGQVGGPGKAAEIRCSQLFDVH